MIQRICSFFLMLYLVFIVINTSQILGEYLRHKGNNYFIFCTNKLLINNRKITGVINILFLMTIPTTIIMYMPHRVILLTTITA